MLESGPLELLPRGFLPANAWGLSSPCFVLFNAGHRTPTSRKALLLASSGKVSQNIYGLDGTSLSEELLRRKEVSLSKEFHRAIKTSRKDCVTASPDVTVKLAEKISKSFLVVLGLGS